MPIDKEDQKKTTFVCEFGSFAYKGMPFGLKNAPAVFSRIVVKTFKELVENETGSRINCLRSNNGGVSHAPILQNHFYII